jgi:hypothetical protein
VELFGALERFAAQIYPYRWIVAIVLLLVGFAGALFAYHTGWHRILWRRKLTTAIVLAPMLAVTLPIGYFLLSPLWTRTHLEEESPIFFVAAGALPAQTAPTPAAASAPSETITPSPTPPPASTPSPVPTDTPITMPANETPPADTPTNPPEPTPEPEPEPTTEPDPAPEPTEFIPHVLLAGQFVGADDFHFGSGTALLIATAEEEFVVRLEDFSVRNGPDLFVYLSTNPEGWSEDALNLGELRATDGSFNYDVPAGVDVSIYRSVVVWCKAFAVLFSTASFE